MRKTCAAKLRTVLSASIASGRLAEDLNELSEAELEFIAYDWELWARDEQLAPSLLAPGAAGCGLVERFSHNIRRPRRYDWRFRPARGTRVGSAKQRLARMDASRRPRLRKDASRG